MIVFIVSPCMMSLTKNLKPETKILFSLPTGRLAESWGFEQLYSTIGRQAMQLRQPKTAGFGMISKYEHIVPWQHWQTTCY